MFLGIIDASLHSSHQCVRDWSGILCERGMGTGNGSGEWEWVRDLGAGVGCASKDIAESPTAIAGTPKLINSSQYIIVVRFLLF